MTDYIKYCQENCKPDATIEEILRDTTRCNFCDVAYIILEDEEERK